MAGIAQTLSSPIIIIFVYLWCEVNTLLHCIGLVSILWPEDRKAIKFVWAEDTQLIEGSITQSIARKWKTRVLGSQYQNMTREFGGGGWIRVFHTCTSKLSVKRFLLSFCAYVITIDISFRVKFTRYLAHLI